MNGEVCPKKCLTGPTLLEMSILKARGNAADEGEFIGWETPVGAMIKLPVGVNVALLVRIKRPQANGESYRVGLNVGESILGTWQMHGIAVGSENIPWNVVASAHGL